MSPRRSNARGSGASRLFAGNVPDDWEQINGPSPSPNSPANAVADESEPKPEPSSPSRDAGEPKPGPVSPLGEPKPEPYLFCTKMYFFSFKMFVFLDNY